MVYFLNSFLDCDKNLDGESGEISAPTFSSLHFSELRCIYTIKVPRGRRITAQLIEGKSITYPCDNQDNIVVFNNYMHKEKLQVFVD